MPFAGGCVLGQNPNAVVAPGLYKGAVVKGMTPGMYSGACKFVGYNAVLGKGACLGLGFGLGVLGPLLLVGIGVTAGYLFFKGRGEQSEDK